MARIVSFLKRRMDILILFFIWLYSSITHFIWLAIDKLPPWGDGISFVLRGMDFFYYQNMYGWGRFLTDLFHFDSFYPTPPVIELTYLLYYKIFGICSNAEMITNSLYLALGIIGVYGIGKYLFNKYTGLLSALVFTSSPGVLVYSKLGFKEFHVMCFFALALYLLLAADNFKSKKYSILFAISLAVMLLIKPEGIIFIIFPLLLSFTRIFARKDILKRRKVLNNFTRTMIITALIFFVWYGVNFFHYTRFLSERVGSDLGINSIYFSFKDLGLYAYLLWNELLTKFQILFFIIVSLYVCARILLPAHKPLIFKRLAFIWFCFLIPFLIFTFLCEKDASHLLSLLVFVSLVIAGGCFLVKNNTVRYSIIFIIVLHCINTQLVSLSELGSDRQKIPLLIKLSPVDNVLYQLRGNIHFPYGREGSVTRNTWRPRFLKIFKAIKNDYNSRAVKDKNSRPRVLLLANSEPFRFFQAEYYNKKAGMPVSLIFFCVEMEFYKDSIFKERYDYIITEEPLDLQYPYHEEARQLQEIYSFIRKNSDKFFKNYEIVTEVELPRDTKAVVYKRVNLKYGQ